MTPFKHSALTLILSFAPACSLAESASMSAAQGSAAPFGKQLFVQGFGSLPAAERAKYIAAAGAWSPVEAYDLVSMLTKAEPGLSGSGSEANYPTLQAYWNKRSVSVTLDVDSFSAQLVVLTQKARDPQGIARVYTSSASDIAVQANLFTILLRQLFLNSKVSTLGLTGLFGSPNPTQQWKEFTEGAAEARRFLDQYRTNGCKPNTRFTSSSGADHRTYGENSELVFNGNVNSKQLQGLSTDAAGADETYQSFRMPPTFCPYGVAQWSLNWNQDGDVHVTAKDRSLTDSQLAGANSALASELGILNLALPLPNSQD